MSELTMAAGQLRGTPLKRIHIVGAGRSGTTLMFHLLVNGFEVDGYSPREQSVINVPNPLASGIYCSKDPRDTRIARLLLRCDPGLWMVFMLRDPRDVIVSRYGKRPDLYWIDVPVWRQAQAVAKRAANHPRFMVVRYENLVTRPDDVQAQLTRWMPSLTVKAPFSQYHLTAEPSKQSLRAMGGLRPVSIGSIGAWRAHKPRIVGQMSLYGSLAQELIELGYEPDDSWLESLVGVEPDYRPGSRQSITDRRQPLLRWALILRYSLMRRLGRLKS